ncbi:MAG: CmpA/NrtA family ABC transporter substrate-binding protein [Actinomycetota bacterium]
MQPDMDRRTALKALGAAAIVPVLASCANDKTKTKFAAAEVKSRSSSAAATSTTPGALRPVKLGFIALTDCAPLVMAKELGFFTRRGLDVQLVKQASWPATRDNLQTGQIDGAHCLFSMPLSVAAGIGGKGARDLKVAMMLSNNGQAITLSGTTFKGVPYGDLAAAKTALDAKPPTLAMTFPGGTHDIWLRYWLKATKADASKVKIIPIPPPQMVQNIKVGAMQGYCVGEPWNAVAVREGVGFTHITTQDIWAHHPEKALVVNEKFAAEKLDVLKDIMAAVLEAQRWLDDPANTPKTAQTIGTDAYIKADPLAIEGRIAGNYDIGDGTKKTFTEDRMRFFRNGAVPPPRKSQAIWFLAQYQRLGLIKEVPPYKEIADSLLLTDLYSEVATAEKVTIPDDDMKPFQIKLDGATFDPAKPQDEVKRA